MAVSTRAGCDSRCFEARWEHKAVTDVQARKVGQTTALADFIGTTPPLGGCTLEKAANGGLQTRNISATMLFLPSLKPEGPPYIAAPSSRASAVLPPRATVSSVVCRPEGLPCTDFLCGVCLHKTFGSCGNDNWAETEQLSPPQPFEPSGPARPPLWRSNEGAGW